MTGNRTPSRPDPRPDARLVSLHAERGDPHARLSGALAALEGADWGLTLAGEAALARQLAALLGPGVLRVDERLGVDRSALAEQGLAAAGLDADWHGARGVWLAEPDDRLLRRAARVGVPVIVDATLAPGGQWFSRGAAYVVYRSGVTLTGFAEPGLALLFGLDGAPAPAAPAPADITVALALRDVATLPLRLARAARTTELLAGRLGGGALPFGPTALLLPPDAAPNTPHPPGGVLAGARSVEGGVVFAPGLQDADSALALLRPDRPAPVDPPRPLVEELDGPDTGEDGQRESAPAPRSHERARTFPDRSTPGSGQGEPPQFSGPQSSQPQPDRPEPDQPGADAPAPGSLTRVTFEAPSAPETGASRAATASPQEAPEETWTPEIVFSSDVPEAPAPLPMPVSAGPDAPELEVTPPLASTDLPVMAPAEEQPDAEQLDEGQMEEGLPEEEREDAEAEETSREPDFAGRDAEPQQAAPEETGPGSAPTPELTPDLPAASGDAPDPTADLTDEQAAIFARLREWRNAEAKRQEVSRFIIASNATLAEIARRVPYTLEDLRAVRGMGPGRLEKYGEKILEVVRG